MILAVNLIQHRFYFLVVENLRSSHVTTGARGCELRGEKIFNPFSRWAVDHFIGRMLVYQAVRIFALGGQPQKLCLREDNRAGTQESNPSLGQVEASYWDRCRRHRTSFLPIDSTVPNAFRADCFAIRSGQARGRAHRPLRTRGQWKRRASGHDGHQTRNESEEF